jgi:hypothetical protein
MPDKKLTILAASLVVLILGHDLDHVVRGDYRAGTYAELVPIAIVTIAKYGILGIGLFLLAKGRVGPGFWAIVAGIGAVLAWLAHFSPFSEQTPQVIYRAYETPAAGGFAVAGLALLMLVLVVTTLYAQYLWARASK